VGDTVVGDTVVEDTAVDVVVVLVARCGARVVDDEDARGEAS
jgi:hypothetical protein